MTLLNIMNHKLILIKFLFIKIIYFIYTKLNNEIKRFFHVYLYTYLYKFNFCNIALQGLS